MSEKIVTNKDFQKLVAHVGHFLKALGDHYRKEDSTYLEKKVTVHYDMAECKSHIYISPNDIYTDNGTEQVISYDIIDKLVELSEKYRISYLVGKDPKGLLHFQIYV